FPSGWQKLSLISDPSSAYQPFRPGLMSEAICPWLSGLTKRAPTSAASSLTSGGLAITGALGSSHAVSGVHGWTTYVRPFTCAWYEQNLVDDPPPLAEQRFAVVSRHTSTAGGMSTMTTAFPGMYPQSWLFQEVSSARIFAS